jgi:hypothetical protein
MYWHHGQFMIAIYVQEKLMFYRKT